MKTITIVAALAVAASIQARADDRKPADTISVAQCLSALQGLRALSGKHDVIVKEDGKDKVASMPWKFDGATLLTIGLDIGALQAVEAAVQHARQDMIGQFADKDGKDPVPGTAPYNAFIRKLQDVLDAPCSIRPGHIRAADLKLGSGPNENAISGDIIGAIAPLIDRE